MKIKSLWLFGSVVTTLVSVPGVASAATISVKLPYEDFGHLQNEDGKCAATATINSFRFLENRYPKIYDRKLTGNDLQRARDDLYRQMGSPSCDASGYYKWWTEKIDWIEGRVSGKTIYGGMVDPEVDISTWLYKEFLTSAFPSFDWLFKELKNGEDVELGILWVCDDPTTPGKIEKCGHALTLTSLSFNDSMDGSIYQNGMWDTLVESAKIDYLDPNNPTQLFSNDLVLDGNGSLAFIWKNGGVNPDTRVNISLAFSESPRNIPESSTVLGLLGLGVFGASSALKRKLKSSKSAEKELEKVG
jgi:hypothetical protein